MDFRDLHAFVHIARHGAFSRAATELRITQSALSRRVARLERLLNAPLFERHRQGVRLTEAGQALFDRAQNLISELNLIERDILALARAPTGQVRIGLMPATANFLVPPLVMELRRRFPGITLQIREGVGTILHDWLINDRVDLALLYSPEPSAEFDSKPLLREPLHLIAPTGALVAGLPPLSAASFNVKNIGKLPLILPSRSHSVRLIVERLAAQYGARLQVVHEVDGMRSTKALVAAGLGYSVLSHTGVHDEIAAGALRMIPFLPKKLFWYLTLAGKHSASNSPAVVEVKKLIQAQIHVLLEQNLWRGELLA